MNIYLIEDKGDGGYDTYDSAVVVASSEDEARAMHPDGGVTPVVVGEFSVWAAIKDVKVTKIGRADNDKAEVVCASFNAG